MAAAKTRKNALLKRMTRKAKRGAKVLDVRSKNHTKLFEKMIVQGPLTLVFARLEGCGPCEQFHKDVWSPLTKLKNRGMNLASIESKMIDSTSLANVPRKFYPTLLLVGPDKKAATFIDSETGESTNAMPRKNTLEEDRATLSALVQNPANANTPMQTNANELAPTVNNTAENNVTEENENENDSENTNMNEADRTVNNIPVRDSPRRAKGANMLETYGASPFEDDGDSVPSLMNTFNRANAVKSPKKALSATGVPDVAADIITSMKPGMKTATAAIVDNDTLPAQKGGGSSCLLSAIMRETEALKAVLNARPNKEKKKRTMKHRR